MNWTLVIDINRTMLLRFVAALFGRIGGGETVARHVHREVVSRLLRVEATARRLIAIAAAGLVVPARAKRAAPAGRIAKGAGERVPPFALFDPRRYAGPPQAATVPGFGPNVRGFDGSGIAPPGKVVVLPDDPVSALRARRRIEAVLAALEDIPAQARRLARRQTRMDRPMRAMRPGRPPGFNARGGLPLDLLLADCHELALMALAEVPP